MSQRLFQDLEQLWGFCMRQGAPSPFLTSSHIFCPTEPTNLAATASLAHNYQDRDDAKTWYSTLIFSAVHQIFLVLLSSRHMTELHFLGPYGWVGPCDQIDQILCILCHGWLSHKTLDKNGLFHDPLLTSLSISKILANHSAPLSAEYLFASHTWLHLVPA